MICKLDLGRHHRALVKGDDGLFYFRFVVLGFELYFFEAFRSLERRGVELVAEAVDDDKRIDLAEFGVGGLCHIDFVKLLVV